MKFLNFVDERCGLESRDLRIHLLVLNIFSRSVFDFERDACVWMALVFKCKVGDAIFAVGDLRTRMIGYCG